MSTFHQIADSIGGSEDIRHKIGLLRNLYDSAIRDFSREHLNLNRLKLEQVEMAKNSQNLTKQITKMSCEIERFRCQVDHLNVELTIKEQTCKVFESKLASIEKCAVDLGKLRDKEMMGLRQEMESMNINLAAKTDEISRLNALVDANRSEISLLKNQLEIATSQKVDETNELERLRNERESVMAMVLKYDGEIRIQLQQHKETINSMHAKGKEQMEMIGKLGQRVEKMEEKAAKMAMENKQLKSDLENLRQEKEDLKKLLEEVEESVKQIDCLMESKEATDELQKVPDDESESKMAEASQHESPEIQESEKVDSVVSERKDKLDSTCDISDDSGNEFEKVDAENEEKIEPKMTWFVI